MILLAGPMASSAVLLAKRSLVKLLLRLAVAYQVVLSLNRDAPDAKVTESFRKVVLKVHPDKGGKLEDSQELHDARDAWEAARLGGHSATCASIVSTRRFRLLLDAPHRAKSS